MSPLDTVLADITMLELARDDLPAHTHIAALFEVTLGRMRDTVDALRRTALRKAA